MWTVPFNTFVSMLLKSQIRKKKWLIFLDFKEKFYRCRRQYFDEIFIADGPQRPACDMLCYCSCLHVFL
jgi:hypothetical protein